MYRCELCGDVTPPGTACQYLVVETRERRYPFREKVFRVVEWTSGRRKVVMHDDPGGAGREIVRELRVCLSCKVEQSSAEP